MAVSGDTYAFGVGNAKPHRLIDRGLRIGDKLFQISVVGFLRITDDRERSVVNDRVAPEEQQSILPKLREGFLRTHNLAGFRWIGIVQRICIKNGGDARALLVAWRRVERERQVQPIGAFVFDQALLDLAYFRRPVGKVCYGYASGSESRFSGGRIN